MLIAEVILGERLTPALCEAFEWDVAKGAIRLGVGYVGLMDDVAIFRRALDAREIGALAAARKW